MQSILSCLLAFLLSFYAFVPTCLSGELPYTAVFCNPGMEFIWPGFHPDYLMVAFTWDEFDGFLRKVKKESHNRPIELCIQVHGTPKGLHLQYEDYKSGETVDDTVTMGYLVNHVERYIGSKNVVLLVESCFGGAAYKNTIRGNQEGENCNHVPQFPIYGGTYNHMNVNNLVYLQYKTKVRRFFKDLREFEVEEGDTNWDLDEESSTHKTMSALYRIMAPLYKN